ncbi:hypothetical protein [Marinivivus vitaminiproducens]|uniref:hypothetical protein n=1 Tax=Marinivivus vitaminiproducens TaxID=3035935 RepID=UPI00279A5DB8|nr:hypothetical protein P4R82_16245 [Geminicoccaceae bacterium SCSIO 64248]
MTLRARTLPALGALLMLGATPALADDTPSGPCLAYDQAIAHLSRQYAETPIGLGLKTDGDLLQIFASRKTGTWTVLSIRPDGTSCVVAAGRSWQEIFDPQDLV